MRDLTAAVVDAIHMAGFVEIEVSAKHVHLTQEDVEVLFGKGAKLEPKRPSNQRVTLIGPKRSMERVAVLGPVRSATQVELSKSDCVALGVDAPIRESGDIAGSGSITIQGPCGSLEVKEGVIIAHNHIHVTEEDSIKMNLKDKDRVAVEVYSDRPVIFNDVIIRVSKNFACRMHIDFDEANAASVSGFTLGRIIRKIDTEGVGRSR